MADGVFRVLLRDGTIRLAVGPAERGPTRVLPLGRSIASLLRSGATGLTQALEAESDDGVMAADVESLLPPVDRQEIWAAGVTYRRSRDARKDESTVADVYDRVYGAERPELFFKAPAWRVVGPEEPIGVRVDSPWNVPEPELGIVVASDGSIAGWVVCNDVSSRTIEGENPLYLPQAKVYDRSCALGPCLVPRSALAGPFEIRLTIRRGGAIAFAGSTSTNELVREVESLVEYLTRALTFPDGAVLLTGTGIVPGPEFTLLADDLVEIEIDGLGILRNPVVMVGRQ
jgi:2-dehydro-3-deoxy-D-arabinonate dehydratase